MALNDYKTSHLYTSDTIGINIKDLERINESAQSLSEHINISINSLYDKPFWWKYNGEYYYYKEMGLAMRLLNELIGEYFSLYMNLPSIKYDLALTNAGICGILSKNFREPNKKYVDAVNLPLWCYIYIGYLLRFQDGNKNELKRKLDSLIAKDLFTCMIDRYSNTICILGDVLDLAPQFDFEYSLSYQDINGYFKEYSKYVNPLFRKFPYYDKKSKAFDEYVLKKYMKFDEQIIRECEKMYNANMEDILEYIALSRKIYIPNELRDYYINFYNNRKKELMKVLR